MELKPYDPIDGEIVAFQPLAPITLASEQALEEVALETADLALSEAEMLGALYEEYLQLGFVRYVLQRGAWRNIPEDSADELARAIAQQIYRAKIGAVLSTIQKSMAVWFIGFVGATFAAIPMAEGAKWATLPSSAIGPVWALLEQPRKRSKSLQQAREVFF
jgi:hypothetical protein